MTALALELVGVSLIAVAVGVHGLELVALVVGVYLLYTARSMR